MRLRFGLLLLAALLPGGRALAQREVSQPRSITQSRWTYGGALGLGLGDVNWVSVTPQVGYLVTPRFWTGVSGTFTFTNDTRYDPDFNSTDYGFGVFTRYFVFDRVFAHVEWNWLSYERLRYLGPATYAGGRDSLTRVLVGGGYAQPLGGASMQLEALYDVTGNAEELYGTNWQFRMGVVAGF